MRPCLVLLLALLSLASALVPCLAQVDDPTQIPFEGRVYKIVDGDTVVLKGGETVRYLNIDTPEVGRPYADEATALNRKFVKFKNVRLELDVEERDVYGRLLAYVYVETKQGWVMVNLELVRAGLARLLFIPPNGKYRGAFEAALQDAMIHRRGMWGSTGGVLGVADLEAKLVEYTNEVATVRFEIMSIATNEDGEIRVGAAESQYGFHAVFSPLCEIPALELGDELTVTGILQCTLREGPYIEVTSLDQVQTGSRTLEPTG
ncbi:MAG: thermonuclease family protein [Candidatus Bipolaricaulota bacterium]|nr:thermonuclease family protein [Candidatus Bipolaricaulota bacterium]